jgi:hypothetical protein
VHEEDGGFDFVGVAEGRHLEVDIGGLPVGALFVLETVGGEGAVVGSGAGDAGAEERGVGEKVGVDDATYPRFVAQAELDWSGSGGVDGHATERGGQRWSV